MKLTDTYKLIDDKVIVNIGDQDVRGAFNTYAVAGSGHARNDILGNVFHPVDLQMVETGGSYRLLVSNYANHKYSFNSSFKLFKGEEADRNNTNTNNIADHTKLKISILTLCHWQNIALKLYMMGTYY